MNEQITKRYDKNKAFDFENAFYYTCSPQRLSKLVAQFKIYQQIINLPGDILEFGVFKGNSLIRLLAFREMLESQYSRKIIGFDSFDYFPKPKIDKFNDTNFIEKFNTEVKDTPYSEEELDEVLKEKNFINYELIKGNIFDTLGEYLDKHPQLKVSLLHIDVDVFDVSKFILEKITPHLTHGAIILFDDYSHVPGETHAVDEFIKEHKLKIQKLNLTHSCCYTEWSILD